MTGGRLQTKRHLYAASAFYCLKAPSLSLSLSSLISPPTDSLPHLCVCTSPVLGSCVSTRRPLKTAHHRYTLYIYLFVCVYIYIKRAHTAERERERETFYSLIILAINEENYRPISPLIILSAYPLSAFSISLFRCCCHWWRPTVKKRPSIAYIYDDEPCRE